jgi:glutamine synthetase
MKKKIKRIELQFTDLEGRIKSIEINPDSYKNCKKYGKGIDGSSIKMTGIEKSDILLKPIPNTFFQLPWDPATGRVLCEIFNPSYNGILDERDECKLSPRFILKKALTRAMEFGYRFVVSAEMEFFILDSDKKPLDSVGYLSPTPMDKTASIRREIFDCMDNIGISGEYSHHEVSKSQHEICLRHGDALKIADNIITFKFLAKNIGYLKNCNITFMPKPFERINGSGMHVHMSLYRGGKNIFYDKKIISETAKNFIAGILKHAKSIALVAAPTINSYKRLVPGYEAPVNIAWGFMNRSALIRIPAFNDRNSARIEVRMPDCMSNPYLLFSCLLEAGLDGIEKNLDPGDACEINTYKEGGNFETLPRTLREAIKAFVSDRLIMKSMRNASKNFEKMKIDEWKRFIKECKVWDPYKITEWELKEYFDRM